MKAATLLMGLMAAGALMACVRTTWMAAEYQQRYYLAEDAHLYRCHSFTGFHSAWFSGPQSVETICSAKIPVANASTIRKGSPVTVLKLFTMDAIDASYSDAKLQIIDGESRAVHVVYVKWPGARSLLATTAPGPQR